MAAPRIRLNIQHAHILFIDIVGFGKLETLNRQDAARLRLDRAIEASDEFQRGMKEEMLALDTGDGAALVFFTDPASPLYCAVQIAEALRDTPDIQIRMGVNTGPVTRSARFGRENVTGNGIIVAQRVMDCGDAGHILLSEGSATTLRQLEEWYAHLTELGIYRDKHGQSFRLYNYADGECGNRAVPSPNLQPVSEETRPPQHGFEIRPATLKQDKARFLETRFQSSIDFEVVNSNRDIRAQEVRPDEREPIPEPASDVEMERRGRATRPLAERQAAQSGVKINPVDGAEMIRIPAGEFLMGSNEVDNEKPIRLVTLDAYAIYKTPVTVAQYRKFCAAMQREMPDAPEWGWNEEHPIVHANWHDAHEYCVWAGGELPTEAQWEKAARGTEGNIYPWGNEWKSDHCRCSVKISGGVYSASAVNRYPAGASPYGALDMAGNVWEWCLDWYEETFYQYASGSNPAGPRTGTRRAIRGGSWGEDVENYFRCSFRSGFSPDYWDSYIGFRCVMF